MKDVYNNPQIRDNGELVDAPLPHEDPADTFSSNPSYNVDLGVVTEQSPHQDAKITYAPHTHEIGYAKHRTEQELGTLGVRGSTEQL